MSVSVPWNSSLTFHFSCVHISDAVVGAFGPTPFHQHLDLLSVRVTVELSCDFLMKIGPYIVFQNRHNRETLDLFKYLITFLLHA